MAASLSCTLVEVAADDAPVAAHECSDGCAHCVAHQGATPAIAVQVGPAQDWPMARDGVPSHRSGALPPPRPGRLERPPSHVSLV